MLCSPASVMSFTTVVFGSRRAAFKNAGHVLLSTFLALVASVGCTTTGEVSDAGIGESGAPTTSDAGAGADSCTDAPYGSCNVSSAATLYQYDGTQNCIGSPMPVHGICENNVYNGKHCPADISLNVDCAIGPDGGIYLATETLFSYLSGPGWRTVYYPSEFGPQEPGAAKATASDLARCNAAFCATACPGATPFPYSTQGSCADAGLDAAAAGA